MKTLFLQSQRRLCLRLTELTSTAEKKRKTKRIVRDGTIMLLHAGCGSAQHQIQDKELKPEQIEEEL